MLSLYGRIYYYIAENTVESRNDLERLAKLFFHYSKQRDVFYNFSIARIEREETTHTR